MNYCSAYLDDATLAAADLFSPQLDVDGIIMPDCCSGGVHLQFACTGLFYPHRTLCGSYGGRNGRRQWSPRWPEFNTGRRVRPS